MNELHSNNYRMDPLPVSLVKATTSKEVYQGVLAEFLEILGGTSALYLVIRRGDHFVLQATLPSSEEKKIITLDKKTLAIIGQRSTFFNVPCEDMNDIRTALDLNNVQTIGILPLQTPHSLHGMIIVVGDFHNIEFGNRNVLSLFAQTSVLALKHQQRLQELRQLKRERETFLSLITHELRTPLTSISGYSQLLKGEVSSSGNKISRWVDELNKETKRMIYTVNDIVEIYRLQSGYDDFNWQIYQLDRLINEAIIDIVGILPNTRFTFTPLPIAMNAVGDPQRIKWAVQILLQHIASYPSGGLITVQLKQKGRYAQLVITDEIESAGSQSMNTGDVANENSLVIQLVKAIIHRHRGLLKYRVLKGNRKRCTVKLPLFQG